MSFAVCCRRVAALLILLPAVAPAAAPQVLPEETKPDDRRLGAPKDLDGDFPFEVPESAETWEKRKEAVRRQVLVATGLWPMPERPPVEATVHGTVDRDDFTVSKVSFESLPGLWVTGSLFRPKGEAGPRPAVLCPHGHWENGRFYDAGDAALKKEIAFGAERFDPSGRYPLQARCVQLARMGCIVFHYDMLGYADSAPLTFDVAHRFAKQRPELSTPERWGMFSAQAELRGVNVLGLQTWNGIRALDWVASLPEVDPTRIGVTGASGGGTQTFLLTAVDDRPAAAFPAVMVSTAMQGGCTCENASYLRVGTGNIELAALTAPRPLGMTAANDWTKELKAKGLPELRRLYALLGVPDRVEGEYFDFGHNYNAVSRHMMYEFFNKHLKLGQPTPVEERDFTPLTQKELTVWDAEHPQPATDEAAEVALMQELDRRSQQQLAKLTPKDAASLDEFRRVVGGAYDVMIGRSAETAGEVVVEGTAKPTDAAFDFHLGRVKNKTYGEEVPTVVMMPKAWNKKIVIWPHRDGKAGLFGENDEPIAAVRKLLDAGYAVLAADLIGQGEHTADGTAWTQSPRVENPREFAGYTLGYNSPLLAQRVHDLLTLVRFSRNQGCTEVTLVGFDEAAAWAAACAQAGDTVDRLAIGPSEFRFGSVTDIRDPNLLPGAVKYGDLGSVLALCAPRPVWVAGEVPELAKAAYAAAGGAIAAGKGSDAEEAATWVIGE